MSKKYLTILLVGLLSLIFTNLFSQNQQNPFTFEEGKSRKQLINPKEIEEKRLCWDDSVFFRSVGLTQGGTFTAAARFDADTMSHYLNYKITKLVFYIADLPSSASLMIWQGVNQNSLFEQLNQSITPQANSWNELALEEPYIIDSSKELWFGIRFESAEGIKPAGTDTLTNAPGKGNMVKIGGNDWTNLSTYHIQGDWNIQAILDTVIIEGFKVTFNVDMTGASFGDNNEAFSPRNHNVYLSGTINEWAEPGTDSNYRLSLIYQEPEEGELPTTLFEGWEEFDEFTLDLSPWTAIMVDSTVTWSFNEFNFPGEGTKFSFMVFNPDSTSPPVSASLPAKTGNQYLIAAQSQVPNDDKWLISPQLMGTPSTALSFWARSMTLAYGAERFQVLISTTTPAIEEFVMISEGDYLEAPLEWAKFEFNLSEYNDQPFYFAIRYVSEDALMLMIDDIEVSGDRPLPDEWIYTLSLYMDEGEVQYKYFVVKDGPTWEFGEWEGGENRRIIVLNDRTLNDIWGVPVSIKPISYEGNSTKLFPNPASDFLYIEHSKDIKEIRVFDITGRMVYALSENNYHSSRLDVKNLNKGVYILQLFDGESVISKKFVIER